jgi:polar amino acid transport system substrate-binding protein
MLSKGRIAVLLDSRFNVEYEILNDNISNLKHVGTDGNFVPFYIGYAPKIDIKYINASDRGLDRLRATNQLLKILERYGITDWQSQSLN